MKSKLHTSSLLLLMVLHLTSSKSTFASEVMPKNGRLSKTVFFEQSTRRNPTTDEKRGILSVVDKDRDTSCTAFFIKNLDDKLFVGTHRHCAGYTFESYCQPGKQRSPIRFNALAYARPTATCKRIVVNNDVNDFIILELQYADKSDEREVRRRIRFLRLADAVPPVGTNLKVIGHPGDNERYGRPTVSENCQIMDGKLPVEKLLSTNEKDAAAKRMAEKSEVERTERKTVVTKAEFVPYNCSTYGGNSGGPVLIADTDVVIGLPGGSYKDLYRKMPKESSMRLESTHGLVESRRQVISDEKILRIDTGAMQNILNRLKQTI